MNNNYCPDIEIKYSLHTTLLEEQKSIINEVIVLSKPGNNNKILEEQCELKHGSVRDYISLITAVRKRNYSFFQFKLRCVALSSTPFFRYDSDGKTHRNMEGPLSEQQVTTPHFQKFTDKGICIAYKTDKLNNPSEAKALEDINICIAHFFDEGNIKLNDSEYPEIKITYETGDKTVEVDPLKDISFNT